MELILGTQNEKGKILGMRTAKGLGRRQNYSEISTPQYTTQESRETVQERRKWGISNVRPARYDHADLSGDIYVGTYVYWTVHHLDS